MNMQRRRIATTTNANASLNSNTADDLTISQDESSVVNFHGLRYCFSIEPENTDANANGWWVVFCLPGDTIKLADLPTTIGTLANDDFNPYIWGVGCWTASNQAPFHMEFAPSTSRNCQRNARITAYVVKEGISAGNVRVIQTMTLFSS